MTQVLFYFINNRERIIGIFIMKQCPVCSSEMTVQKLQCTCCNIAVEGHFHFPALMRLPQEHYRLAEMLVLTGGNLKDMAIKMGISYPTLRKRVDSLMESLRTIKHADEQTLDIILDDIEQGRLTPEEGIRKTKEIKGEL